ncbi:Zinc-binding protein A33 [Triplophysa tibetana]|uniref:Zinc-binding protein A33 n=1 Tax=Triplophysa tibetana TaxID=1572043 RepID=A0A5A9PG98_9TELE|nr:Zinc-binding protein A33 [Triplophysa tibetana]
MAEALPFLEEDLTCIICCDVYINPVTLKCSHSLCEKCLQEFWRTQDVIQCPVCRKECSPDEPTKSLAFKSLCESFKTRKPTADPEDICQEHKEKLKLFCFEDKKPICVVCYTSKKHENHKCSPVEEAVVTVKEDLKERIEKLQVTLGKLKKAQDSYMKQDELIELKDVLQLFQEHNSVEENRIKKEFEKLHQFLKDEEDKWIRTMRKVVKYQDVKTRSRLEQLSKQISALSEQVAAVWQDLEAENITLLQNYTENIQRLQCPSFPKTSLEIKKYQHHPTQTMIFTTWVKMQKLVEKAPVMLDPNTASYKLLVSKDCYSVQHVKKKVSVPENPERLHLGVLASQGFSSGLHCWDVEVGDNDHWTLGVVGATVYKKRPFIMDPRSRFWCFRYVDGIYRKSNKPFKHNERPYIIRLQLDFDKGELKFIDSFRNKSLCTFTGGFSEKVFPYFCTGDLDKPLNLYPGK